MHTVTALLTRGLAWLSQGTDVARWEREARNVTIIRDDWGIAHVYGKTDADAVFGMEYAQAEDDFNRVETNYLNALGRLAEADGPAAIYSYLRMKLFIEPDSLRAQYRRSPAWLRRLMDAFADGLNFYLHTHPEVKPRVITRFEPWMALSFTEGSIGVTSSAWSSRTSRRSTAARRPARRSRGATVQPPRGVGPTASPSRRSSRETTMRSC